MPSMCIEQQTFVHSFKHLFTFTLHPASPTSSCIYFHTFTGSRGRWHQFPSPVLNPGLPCHISLESLLLLGRSPPYTSPGVPIFREPACSSTSFHRKHSLDPGFAPLTTTWSFLPFFQISQKLALIWLWFPQSIVPPTLSGFSPCYSAEIILEVPWHMTQTLWLLYDFSRLPCSPPTIYISPPTIYINIPLEVGWTIWSCCNRGLKWLNTVNFISILDGLT